MLLGELYASYTELSRSEGEVEEDSFFSTSAEASVGEEENGILFAS